MPNDNRGPTVTLQRIYALLAFTLCVTSLFVAREILLPVMLSILLAFLLTPATRFLERFGWWRIASVSTVVLLSLACASILLWIVAAQFVDLSARMPQYKGNLLAKVRAARSATQSSFTNAAQTIQELGQELHSDDHLDTNKNATSLSGRLIEYFEGTEQRPANTPATMDVRVVSLPPSPMTQIQTWLGPLVAPLTSAGVILVLVIFLMLHREDLRDRLLQLAGTSNLHLSTVAINEAGQRISHYLRMQLLLNTVYGVLVMAGLFAIGIPNAMLWGVLGIAFRFVPYVGPWFIFAVPMTLSLALSTTWTAPLLTVALFVVLELILNNGLEPWLYGRSTGVSSVGVILSVIFWAWIWGPIGLVLATPLTVCLVVMGKHFPPLQFMTTLFGEQESLQPPARLYQRLLVDDLAEVEQIVSDVPEGETPLKLFDRLFIPTVHLMEMNRHSLQLDDDQAQRMLAILLQYARELDASESSETLPKFERPERFRVLIVPDRDDADSAIGQLLQHVLQIAGVQVDLLTNDVLAGELTKRVVEFSADIVVISAMPPVTAQTSMHMIKRLRQHFATLPILVGVWDKEHAEQARERLMAAGATLVESQLVAVLRAIHNYRPVATTRIVQEVQAS